jgi:cleavage and polyadenylation specificity factor subunit 3
MIKFVPLGGADEIGAGSFYLNAGGTGLLLDCGIHPQKPFPEALPKFDYLTDQPLDYVFISHAHQDHIGALPFLIQKFPHAIVFSTIQTAEIAELTLHNAANILSHECTGNSGLKFYKHDEINLLVRSIRTVDYSHTIEIRGLRHNSPLPLKITFIDAGHILGSAGIMIEFNGHKIFYTGDINIGNQSIMTGAELDSIGKVDTLILESTYGATDTKRLGTWKSELDRFAGHAARVIHRGGSILIPVFALGKTQELLSAIHRLILKGKIPETDLYSGGISREISRIYDLNRFLVRRQNSGLELKKIPQLNLMEVTDFAHFSRHPGIVLASSGMMLPGTTSFRLLDYWLRQKDFAICGVGYMDPDSPGYKVITSERGSEIILTDPELVYKIECEIDRFYFPSHSTREELLSIVAKTEPSNIILVHGEEKSKDWLGSRILQQMELTRLYSARLLNEILLVEN